eukprot:3759196-Karenia_brevis.AAC.1
MHQHRTLPLLAHIDGRTETDHFMCYLHLAESPQRVLPLPTLLTHKDGRVEADHIIQLHPTGHQPGLLPLPATPAR